MGYEAFEQPMIRAMIYYRDNDSYSSPEFSEKLLFVFNKYGYEDITNIELGKHRETKGILEDYIVCYNKKDLSVIDLSTELLKWVNDDDVAYISFVHKKKHRWVWDITWYKNYIMQDGISIKDYTFNYLTLMSSYDGLDSKNAQNAYIDLFCELSDLFRAFYGNIEDVATAVEILEGTREKVFNPNRIQAVYWGNYFSESCCSKKRIEKLEKAPVNTVKSTERGIFLAITNDLLDSKNHFNLRDRIKILKHLTR